MYSKELKKLFTDPIIKRPSSKCKKGTSLGNTLLEETNFLIGSHTLATRLWYVENDIHHQVKCPNCGKPTNVKVNKDGGKIQFCSLTCRSNHILEDGLTLAKQNGIKQSKTKSSINPETGNTLAKDSSIKAAQTMKTTLIDGKSLEEIRIAKTVKTKAEREYTAWNKGLSTPDDIKQKLSKTVKKQYDNGRVHHNLGKETTIEVKEKISHTLSSQKLSMSDESKLLRLKTYERMKQEGWIHPSQRPEIRQKIVETQIKRYNRNSFNQAHISLDVLSKLESRDWLYNEHVIKQQSLITIAKKLNVNGTTVGRYLRKAGIETQQFSRSTQEAELFDFVNNTLDCEIVANTRTVIAPKELDIFIPSLNLAIEYCGLFWHNSVILHNNYHVEKLRKCNELGIRLITIFEDEWINKTDIVKSKLLSIFNKDNNLKVYGRKCDISKVSTPDKKDFFEHNHIQGDAASSINYGLYNNNELVACCSFVKRKYGYELIRYATKYNVIGGFSKLLKHFIKHNSNNTLVSFADLRWSEGDLYLKTGWTLDKTLKPDYSYILGQERCHKFNFRHNSGLKHLKNYNPELSEFENTENHNIHRIYDCGKLRFTLKT